MKLVVQIPNFWGVYTSRLPPPSPSSLKQCIYDNTFLPMTPYRRPQSRSAVDSPLQRPAAVPANYASLLTARTCVESLHTYLWLY